MFPISKEACVCSRNKKSRRGDLDLSDKKTGDRCSTKFVKAVRKQTIISELRDNKGRCFTKMKDLEKVCFYLNL
jgi:hypothetical protein